MEKASGTSKAANGTLYALWYGGAKTYKTTGALMVPPELRPCAYLETERKGSAQFRLRLLTGEHVSESEAPPAGAGAWCAEQLDFFWPSEERWYEDCFEFATKVASEYRTVVVDSGSRLADGIMQQALTLDYPGSKGRVTLAGAAPQDPAAATKHPQPSDYGFVQDRFMTLMRLLDSSKAHLLVLSHEKVAEIKDDASKKLLKCFGGPRSSGNALLEMWPSLPDLVIRLESQSRPELAGGKLTGRILTRSVVRTQNHGEGLNGTMYPCGDRIGLFKDGEIFEPAAWWGKVAGYLKGRA